MSFFVRSERLKRETVRTLAGVSLLAGATACAHIGNGNLVEQADASSSRSMIIHAGAHVRTDPEVLTDDSDGGTNICATVPVQINMFNAPVMRYGTGVENDDWTGIQRRDITPFLGKACSYDKDGIVWVNDVNIELLP